MDDNDVLERLAALQLATCTDKCRGDLSCPVQVALYYNDLTNEQLDRWKKEHGYGE